jgi:hypothetical protein
MDLRLRAAPSSKRPRAALSYDANHRQVSADYLKTMGVPIVQGRRAFADTDNEQSIPWRS